MDEPGGDWCIPVLREADKLTPDKFAELVQCVVHRVCRSNQPGQQTLISENENSQPENSIQPQSHASINSIVDTRLCAGFDIP